MSKTILTPTITVDTAQYSAGDSVGGKLTLSLALKAGHGASLESLVVLDRANQKAAFELLIFESDPTVATITNNAAFVFSTDDLKVIARIAVAAADYVTINSKAVAMLKNIGALLKA